MTTTNNQNIPKSFTEVIPNLQFLKSGFPNTSVKTSKESYIQNLSSSSEVATIVGLTITSQQLRKVLKDKAGKILIKQPTDYTSPDYKWQDNTPKVLDTLNIYCDELILDEDLWVPETNINIIAKTINMQNHKIISSPLMWKATKDAHEIPTTETNGKHGKNGGNISIKTEKIIALGKIIANGSDGTSVFFPKFKIDQPGYLPKGQKKDICFFQGCKGEKAWSHVYRSVNYNQNVVGIIGSYGITSSTSTRKDNISGYISMDHTIIYENGKFEDTKVGKRIIEHKTFYPGKGGNAGKVLIITNSTKISSDALDSQGGKSGSYIEKKEYTNGALYKSLDDKFKTLEGNKYYLGYSRHVYVYGVFKDTSTPGEYKLLEPSITIPNYTKELKNLKYDEASLNKHITKGSKGTSNIQKEEYIINRQHLKVKTKYFIDRYFFYAQLETKTAKELDQECKNFVKYLSHLSELHQQKKITFSDDLLEDALQTALSSLSKFLFKQNKNLDHFGNSLGYRPMLAIQTITSYMQHNFASDIKLFVQSDEMAREETKRGDILGNIKGMIIQMGNKQELLLTERQNLYKEFDDLQEKIKTCKKLTDEIKEDLEKKEEELTKKIKEEAQDEQRKKQILQGIFKGLSIATCAIPYGQPITGQVVGNALNSIASNLNLPTSEIVASTFSSIDMSGVIDKLAERRIKPLSNTGQYFLEVDLINQSNDNNDFIDTSRLTIEHSQTINKDKIAKLAKLKKKYNTYATNLQKVTQDWKSYAVPKSEIEAKINEIMATSPEFHFLNAKLKKQLDLRTEIMSSVLKNMQRLVEVNALLFENLDNIRNLHLIQLNATYYNKEMKLELVKMSASILARLQWMEYQLTKIYEYTTLETYKSNTSCFEIFHIQYQRFIKPNSQITLDEKVKHLSTSFQNCLNTIQSKLLDKANNSYQEDAQEANLGRKIILTEELVPEKMRELNDKGFTYIDLQKDLVDVIISPLQSNIRISDIQFDKIEFNNNSSSPINVIAEIEKNGVLRKDNQFYFFQTKKGDEGIDQWSWTLDKNGNVTNKSIPAINVNEMIQQISTNHQQTINSSQKVFTYPPAMTNMLIKIIKPKDVTIKAISFSLRCTYKSISLNSSNKVLDIKLDKPSIGTEYSLIINGKSESHCNNYYNVLDTNSTVKLELKPSSKDLNRTFSHWHCHGTDFKEEKNTLSFKLTDNVRIRAVFKKTTSATKSIPQYGVAANYTEQKPSLVTIYNQASNQATIVGRVLEDDGYIKVDSPVGGFQRVIYGMQEAYIKV